LPRGKIKGLEKKQQRRVRKDRGIKEWRNEGGGAIGSLATIKIGRVAKTTSQSDWPKRFIPEDREDKEKKVGNDEGILLHQ